MQFLMQEVKLDMKLPGKNVYETAILETTEVSETDITCY